MDTPAEPRFSVISAVYDVARYLPDFIACIDAQTFDLDRVEVVAVDDGSRDGSLRLLEEWAERRPGLVRVVSQANAGQGAARNTGLDHARGQWVTFPDPDDVVDPNYLEVVDRFLQDHPSTDLVATNRWIWREDRGTVLNTHPLERFFRSDRLVDLEESGSRFHGGAPAAFFRRETLQGHQLRFDGRIRPNFEDGHFTARYLLHHERPQVGFLRGTRYHYRKRSDQSSSLGGSLTDPRRYSDVFTHGYLAVLDEADRLRGGVPAWLRHFLCYEMVGYFQAARSSTLAVLSEGPVIEEFHRLVAEVLRRTDAEHTLADQEFRCHPTARLVARFGYGEGPWCDDAVRVDRHDADQHLVRLRYRYRGPAPDELLHVGRPAGGPPPRQDPVPGLLRPHGAARADPVGALPPRRAHPARRPLAPAGLRGDRGLGPDQGGADDGAPPDRRRAQRRGVPPPIPHQGRPAAPAPGLLADGAAALRPRLGADGPHPRRR